MAASAGAIRAGAAYVEIFANDSKFQQGMTRVRTTMATVGQQLRRAGTSVFVGGAAIAAPMVAAVRQAAAFEDALLDARASAGLTAAQVQQMKQRVTELSVAGVGSEAAIAQTMTALIKAGMPLEQVLAGAGESVTKFARVTGVETQRAAEIVAGAMSLFNVSAEEAGNFLKAAADSSQTDVPRIAQAFSQTAKVASASGQTMETTSAALAILAKNMTDGSDAGTALKTFLLRLRTGAGEAADGMAELGLSVASFRDQGGTPLPIGAQMDILRAKLQGVDKIAQDKILFKIFGSDAIRAAEIFLDAGSAGFAKMQSDMRGSMTVGDAFNVKMSGITGTFERMSAAVGRFSTTFTDVAGSAFAKGFGQQFVAIAESMRHLMELSPQLTQMVGQLSVVMIGSGAGAIALGSALSGMATIIGVVQKAMALLHVAVMSPAILTAAAIIGTALASMALGAKLAGADFGSLKNEYLLMIRAMERNAPRDIVGDKELRDAMVSFSGPEALRKMQQEQVATLGEGDIATQMRDLAQKEIGIIEAHPRMSEDEKTGRISKLNDIIRRLEAQIAARPAAQAAEAETAPVAAGAAGPTQEQLDAAAKIREENMTPAQKTDAERNRLLDLLNAKALSEEEFLQAVNRIEEDANKDRISQAQGKAKELQDKADALREQMATPEETLRKRIAEIQSLPLDPDTRARAIERAKADAVSALTTQGGEGRSIVSAGTFGDAAMLGIGPELADPARETAENTRRMVEEIARLATAVGEPAVQAGVPVQPPALPFGIGAEVAAPKAAEVRQAVDNGMAAAGETMTLSQTMQATTAQVVAAIGRTTEAVEKTLTALEQIATNTTDMGAVFL